MKDLITSIAHFLKWLLVIVMLLLMVGMLEFISNPMKFVSH